MISQCRGGGKLGTWQKGGKGRGGPIAEKEGVWPLAIVAGKGAWHLTFQASQSGCCREGGMAPYRQGGKERGGPIAMLAPGR
jgi:hypothetical protein